MWQIYSNDSAVARGVSRWKTNPLFFRPFSHSRTLFRPLYSLFKSIWIFSLFFSYCEKKQKKTKWKDCLGLIHFPPRQHLPFAAAPNYNDRLCASQCRCHVDVSVIKQACNSSYCDIHVWRLKLFWGAHPTHDRALVQVLLSLLWAFLRSAADPGDCLESSPTLRGQRALVLRQLTPTTSPFLHGEICITAIATIASLCPRKEEKGREEKILACHRS